MLNLFPFPSWEAVFAYKSLLLLFFFSIWLSSNISSGVGEYSIFLGGTAISKRRLGQHSFSDLILRCVSCTGFFIFSLIRKVN